MGETNVYVALAPSAPRAATKHRVLARSHTRILWAQALRHQVPERRAALVPSALCEQSWVSMYQAVLRETRAPPPSQRNALRIA